MSVSCRCFRASCLVGRFLLSGLFALGGGSCTKGKPPPPGNPQYLRIYELREEPDDTFKIPIKDSSGAEWFHEDKAAFDLRDFIYFDAYAGESKDGYYIDVPLTNANQSRMHDWSGARIGKPLGLVVDNRLTRVHRIQAAISGAIRFSVEDPEQLRRVAHALRAGGVPSSTRPGSGQ